MFTQNVREGFRSLGTLSKCRRKSSEDSTPRWWSHWWTHRTWHSFHTCCFSMFFGCVVKHLSSLFFHSGFFRWLYERFRLPAAPVYGGFPVKFRTFLGDPIPYEPNVNAAELAHKVSELTLWSFFLSSCVISLQFRSYEHGRFQSMMVSWVTSAFVVRDSHAEGMIHGRCRAAVRCKRFTTGQNTSA